MAPALSAIELRPWHYSLGFGTRAINASSLLSPVDAGAPSRRPTEAAVPHSVQNFEPGWRLRLHGLQWAVSAPPQDGQKSAVRGAWAEHAEQVTVGAGAGAGRGVRSTAASPPDAWSAESGMTTMRSKPIGPRMKPTKKPNVPRPFWLPIAYPPTPNNVPTSREIRHALSLTGTSTNAFDGDGTTRVADPTPGVTTSPSGCPGGGRARTCPAYRESPSQRHRRPPGTRTRRVARPGLKSTRTTTPALSRPPAGRANAPKSTTTSSPGSRLLRPDLPLCMAPPLALSL